MTSWIIPSDRWEYYLQRHTGTNGYRSYTWFCGKTSCNFKAALCTSTHSLSPASWCSHACVPAMGSGCVWEGLQPVHGRAAVGAVPWRPYGVQAGDGSSAVLLGHRLWQQHLPECPRFWPASPLPGGDLWESSESLPQIGVSLFQEFASGKMLFLKKDGIYSFTMQVKDTHIFFCDCPLFPAQSIRNKIV